MLNFTLNGENTWNPDAIADEKINDLIQDVSEFTDGYLLIFQIEPYIDSLFIDFDKKQSVMKTTRFVFHEDYIWDMNAELLFEERCVLNKRVKYTYGAINLIFDYYSDKHPEWNLKRYYTQDMKLLDHIYHCMRKDSAKEILYKTGLDELAVNLHLMDEYDLLSTKPSDIYENISLRTLRSLNCSAGAKLLAEHDSRVYLRRLQQASPGVFANKMNDAQASYLNRMIQSDFTVEETSRLFEARRSKLGAIWIRAQYDNFIAYEEFKDVTESELSKIDDIYKDSIDNGRIRKKDLSRLSFYLLQNREELNNKVRRSNRKRSQEWQERDCGYVVRFPQTVNDFCREAIYQSNCLLGYLDEYVDNITDIMFIRRQDDVNCPYITMEIYQNELYQAYRRFNEDCTPEEAQWIKDFCERHGILHDRFKFEWSLDHTF